MHNRTLLLTPSECQERHVDPAPHTLDVSFRTRKPVMIESPLGGDFQENVKYARLCLRLSMLNHNEAPMAFHLLYPQALCDDACQERAMGLARGFDWHGVAQAKVFYLDRGVSQGMILGYLDALEKGIQCEFRTLSTDLNLRRWVRAWNGALEPVDIHAVREQVASLRLQPDMSGWRYPGDVIAYRHRWVQDIMALDAQELEATCPELEYTRLCLRQSLRTGYAPLPTSLMEDQLVRQGEGLLAGTWQPHAPTVELYVDRGVTPAMAEMVQRNINQGLNLEVRALTTDKDVQFSLASVNVHPDQAARLRLATSLGAELAQRTDYLTQRQTERQLIRRLNDPHYASRERSVNPTP